MNDVHGFHAHVYFDDSSFERALALCEQARDRFSIQMGRMHRSPIGPHPCGSCQLAFGPERFGDVVPWLALNRGGLIIFVHPQTGDDLKDHTEHALWMGEIRELNLSAL